MKVLLFFASIFCLQTLNAADSKPKVGQFLTLEGHKTIDGLHHEVHRRIAVEKYDKRMRQFTVSDITLSSNGNSVDQGYVQSEGQLQNQYRNNAATVPFCGNLLGALENIETQLGTILTCRFDRNAEEGDVQIWFSDFAPFGVVKKRISYKNGDDLEYEITDYSW
ncbi:MAG: hypothetical protein KDD25_10070 [Bdellovibrionales bacterium]|nr:hypothetical protein [Bdellovibrionales bacterium]